MFHFLQTLKKDAGNAVSGVAKAGHAVGHFVASTGDEIGQVGSTIVHHPVQAVEATGSAIAQPFEDVGKKLVSQAKYLSQPAATDSQRKALIDNQAAAAKSPEYQKAIKGLDPHGNSIAGVNEAQKLAANGGKAADIRALLQKDAKAKAANDKKAAGDALQIASTVSGAGVVKDVADAGKGASALSAAEKAKAALTTVKNVGVEGAATGAESSAGSQLGEGKNVNIQQTLKDALTGAAVSETGLAGKGVVKGTTKAAPALIKQIDDTASNVASKHPAVQALNDHLQQLSQHREQLVANGASHTAIQANDTAYTQALKARDNTIKAIKEGGFVGSGDDVPGTSKDTKDFMSALTGTPAEKSQALDDMEAAGAKTAVTPTQSPKGNFKAALTGSPTKPGYTPTEAKSTAQLANESLPKGAKLDDNVVELLDKTGKATDAASKAPVLEGARDPHSVAARYFGKEGSDIIYDATKGAKTRSDLQGEANPMIDDAEKKLKKAAKTKAGQADVESRINQALEDRDNADTYLKTPAEKDAYEAAKTFYDHYQGKLEAAGKGTLENYSPRIARKNAEDSSAGLDRSVTQAFSKNTDASFLKERTEGEPDQALLERPISAMRNYSSAVSKQLAYEDMMKKLPERLQNVKPIYTADAATKQKGTAYLQKYLKDLLQPDVPTNGKGLGKVIGEKTQNKLIGQTYKSALQLSPKFGLMNRTQGYATHSQVSAEARKLARKMDKKDLEDLRGAITTGDAGVSNEAEQTASNAGRTTSKLDKIQAKVSGEQKNVNHAFNAGAAQHIVDSPAYKAAIKAGMKPKEAAKEALKDPATRELAERAGNVVVNTTQFGGNIANKPEWLRETGTVLGLSKKWFQQYQRFPLGMLQLAGNITNPKTARALDIMRRGDPKQTKLVDYLKAAKTLQNALPDAKKAVKAGEGGGVTPEQLKASKDLLDKSIKVLDKQIKQNSQIRAGKTTRKIIKMWAAASAIQFLFDGATGGSQDKTTTQKVSKAVRYGAPINIPTKDENPLTPSPASSPIGKYGINKGKLLNFVPVAGPLYNRGREVKGFISALTGDNN